MIPDRNDHKDDISKTRRYNPNEDLTGAFQASIDEDSTNQGDISGTVTPKQAGLNIVAEESAKDKKRRN